MYNVWWLAIGGGLITTLSIIAYFIIRVIEDKFISDLPHILSIIIGIIGLIVCITCCVIAGAIQVTAKNEYNQFIETKVMVEQIYNDADYTEYENAGINNKIIEMNQWLVKAKTSKKQWGNWSVYCMFDIDSLDYILLIKGDNNDYLQ